MNRTVGVAGDVSSESESTNPIGGHDFVLTEITQRGIMVLAGFRKYQVVTPLSDQAITSRYIDKVLVNIVV